MTHFSRFALSFLGALIIATSLNAQAADELYYSGRLWVQMNPSYVKSVESNKKSVSLDSFTSIIGDDLADQYGLFEVRKPFYFAKSNDIREVYQLFFSEDATALDFARVLETLPAVNYAEREPVMRPTLTPNDLGPQSGNGSQWGLWQIQAQNAWDISIGSGEIVVAIVDDAVLTTHPDLAPDIVPGYDVASDDNNANPNVPGMTHGTHVAGIVGAATNNGIGVASIGFNVKIMPVKSSNVPQTISDAYAGVIWAADNGADVINMSWGGGGFSQTGQNIINYAYNAGCVNIAAAGNDNVNSVFYPAGYNNVISVASTTTGDAKSSFSNYGSWIDISAPGSSILSTYFNGSYQPTYANLSGTSMASPMVAGLAGLILSINPDLPQAQVEDCILSTADNINQANPSFIGQLGAGRINAFQAALCAQATVNAPPVAVISTNNNVACPGGLIQFFGSSAGGLATGYNWTFPGGNPATSTVQNPIVSYSGEGFYDVSLTVTNDFGNNSVTQTGFVEISSNGVDIFFSEGFESGTFAGLGWIVENPDNSITWEINTIGGSVSGNKAAGINLYSYNSPGQRDGLVTPSIDLSNHENVQLDFQHAHRRFSQDYSDSLIVYVSTDGGATFPHRILEIAETGQGTFATGTILNSNFIPANGNDWCFGGEIGSGCFTLDLSEFDGQTNVKLKFETYNDYGNNIYLDNIELSGNCLTVQSAPVAGLNASQTGLCAGQGVQFTDQSLFVPSEYLWEFEGGSPATSDMAAPFVTYNTPGSYDVTLTVTNAWGSDQLVLTNHIVVSEAPVLSVNGTELVSCAGEPVTLSASGADEYFWSPDIALSATTGSSVEASPAASLTYTVTGSISGCSSQQTIDVIVIPSPPVPDVVVQNDVAFTVLEPLSVQGHFDYVVPSTGWGTPNFNTVSVSAEMVIGRDASAGDSLLCGSAINGAAISGKIAVVYRGGCEFGTKAFNAQQAGAVGVIVVNNISGTPIDMGAGAQGGAVNIPVIMVSDVTGAWLNSAINAGGAEAVIGQFNGGGFEICPGETVRLAAPGGWSSYEWSNGYEGAVIEITEPGNYSVEVFGGEACGTASASFTIVPSELEQPVIEPLGADQLTVNAPGATSFQWFLDGEPIPGATGSTIDFQGAGTYTVVVGNNSGCEAVSDPYLITTTGITGELTPEGIEVFPVPASEQLFVRLPDNFSPENLTVFSATGKVILQTGQMNVSGGILTLNADSWAPGVYIVQVSDKNSIYSSRFIITR